MSQWTRWICTVHAANVIISNLKPKNRTKPRNVNMRCHTVQIAPANLDESVTMSMVDTYVQGVTTKWILCRIELEYGRYKNMYIVTHTPEIMELSQDTLHTHFARHGFADWVEFSANGLYVSLHHMTGSVEILLHTIEHVVLRNAWGDIKHEYDQDTYVTAYNGHISYRGENPLHAIDEIESLIAQYTGLTVRINREYVEAYMITNHSPLYAYTALDVPKYNGVRVNGLTVADMLRCGGLDWSTCPKGYKLDRIADLLDTPEVLGMSFVDFYTLIHDNVHKADYRERVMAAIGNIYTTSY